MGHDPLGLDPDTMRLMGYQVIDWLVDRAAGRDEEAVLRQRTPSELARDVDGAVPSRGQEMGVLLDQLATRVLPFRSRIDHPRYLAYVPGEGTWPGALGDLIASTYNIDAGNWMESAGPTHLERVVLRWFADWIGYPETAGGVLVSGGSAANLTALACAREALAGAMRDDLVAYVSDQGHSSLARAARILGFRPQQVRVIPVDSGFRMRTDALNAAIDADLAAGRSPLAVLAVAGTTNTGAVDRLPDIAEICRRHGVWLHVDAAYGGFAAITPGGKALLDGLELADSVTLDPHKWLYQPIECGALLVRDGRLLREAFEIHPAYLQDSLVKNDEVNFADYGLQLTRTSRALKIWLSVQYFGVEAFAAAVDGALALAREAQRSIEASPVLELVAPATLGIVCFRRHPEGMDDEEQLEQLNAALVTALADSGRALVSSTRLHGRYAVRACILNHGTTAADVKEVLAWFEAAAVPSGGRKLEPGSMRTADVASGWPRPPLATVEQLRASPLLEGVEERWVSWVGTVGRRRHVDAGDTIVRQWDVDRDFFLLLGGTADVFGTAGLLRSLQPGDFFGELAALDWGASFGYPRLATVTARTDLDLLVLTDLELRELMAAAPRVDARIRAAAGARARRV
ncbi:MAG: aminotransferase class I/II-fold pyridoxal phosphate-dependent enzyme [Nocardioidaceae bacterium]